jgi:site-specific DNA recombinase
MRAALYTRVSTSEQATEGNSLDAQLAALRTYAKLHNYEIWEEYVDGGYSGGTDQRPALQRLMHDAIAHRFDILICAKLDRLFRNIRLLLNYLHQLDQLGITFIATQEGLDTSTPNGKFSIQILGVIAEFEHGRIGDRVKDARRHLASKHQWSSGRTPFGYRFNKETKELVIEPLESEVIQFAFNRYLNDSLGIIRLAELLNSERKTTPRLGHRKHNLWTQSAVRYVLTHHAYKGGPNESWRFKCPAIVDPITWELVQKRLSNNRHFRPVTTKREFQGLLRCGLCGHTLRIGYNHNTNPHYECPGRTAKLHLDGSPRCKLPRLEADILDESLSKQVSKIFSDPEQFKKHITETINNLESEIRELEHRLKPLQAETDRIKHDMEVADTKFEVGRLDGATYKAIIAGLKAKLRGIERQQIEADPMLIGLYKVKLDYLEIVKDTFNWRDTYNSEAEWSKGEWDVLSQFWPNIEKRGIAKLGKETWERYSGMVNPHFSGTPREVMQKWGMVGFVYPDRIELKGNLRIGNPDISPGYRSSHYPQFQ